MITAISSNPAIDKEVRVREFHTGVLNRVLDARSDASGKGINVAVVLKRLGIDAACIGFNYNGNGHLAVERMQREGIRYDFVYVDGDIRTNLKVIDDAGEMTEINESGGPVTVQAVADLEIKVTEYAQMSSAMVFSGSVPPGAGTDYYYRMLSAARATRCALDCDGELFRKGLEAQPFLVKPNLYELEMYTRETLSSRTDILRAASTLLDKGVKVVLVTLGADGAIATDGSKSCYVPPLKVTVKNTVGAGDSATAGFLSALEEGREFLECVRSSAAAATASILSEGSQLLDIRDYHELMKSVILEEL